jgi:hypothetical protein
VCHPVIFLLETNDAEGCFSAGTGLLAATLGRLCRRYTATDIPDLVPLIRKNIKPKEMTIKLKAHAGAEASEVAAEALDWTTIHSTPRSLWSKLRLLPELTSVETGCLDLDVVLVVDCIYHPNLISPLLATLDYLGSMSVSSPEVVVVAELRSEEVVREFVDGWVQMDGWTIWSLETGEEEKGLGPRYGTWLGRKCVPWDGYSHV